MSDSLAGVGGPQWAPTARDPQPVARQQAQGTQYRGRELAAQPARTELPNAANVGPEPTQPRPLTQRRARFAPDPVNSLRDAARFMGLPSRTDLESSVGRPKNDIKFWFFGTRTIRRSTAYKELLNKIDDWQAKAAAPTGQDRSQRLAELNDQLSILGQAAEECVGKGSRSRRAAVREIIAQVGERQFGAESVSASAARGAALPDGMPVADMIGYASAGVSVQDMEALSNEGVPAQHAVMLSRHISLDVRRSLADAGVSTSDFIGYVATEPDLAPAVAKGFQDHPEAFGMVNDFKQADLSAERLAGYLGNGVTPQDALVHHNGGLPYDLDGITAAHLLPPNADVEIKYTQKDVLEPLKTLGAGGCNQVYTTTYADGETRVFKPLAPPSPDRSMKVENGWVAGHTGVDLFNPQIAMRNMATCKLADALGFDVVAKTELGVQNAPPASARGAVPPRRQWKPQLGLVMESAQGRNGNQVPIGWLSKPEVRRELTKLQLLDALTGQGDRHRWNYFIQDLGQGQFKVTGIDNDQCFGKGLRNPNGIAQGDEPHNFGFRGCRLPGVIDNDIAQAIERLQPEELDGILGGMLTGEEVNAAKDRLAGVKRHVAGLRAKGAVMNIPPDDWGLGKQVSVLRRRSVESYNNTGTSYFVRDLGLRRGI